MFSREGDEPTRTPMTSAELAADQALMTLSRVGYGDSEGPGRVTEEQIAAAEVVLSAEGLRTQEEIQEVLGVWESAR